jgi:uncharacterized membrane protein YqiK
MMTSNVLLILLLRLLMLMLMLMLMLIADRQGVLLRMWRGSLTMQT